MDPRLTYPEAHIRPRVREQEQETFGGIHRGPTFHTELEVPRDGLAAATAVDGPCGVRPGASCPAHLIAVIASPCGGRGRGRVGAGKRETMEPPIRRAPGLCPDCTPKPQRAEIALSLMGLTQSGILTDKTCKMETKTCQTRHAHRLQPAPNVDVGRLQPGLACWEVGLLGAHTKSVV